jgi:hypothetical protein
MTQLDGAVRLLKAEHDRLTKQMRGISAALSAFGAAYGKRTTVRKISAAGRARIAEAQRLRWAKVKGNSGQMKGAAPASPKKRTMSAAARKRIGAAQRARWAKVRAANKRAA